MLPAPPECLILHRSVQIARAYLRHRSVGTICTDLLSLPGRDRPACEFCTSECVHLELLDVLLDNLQQRAILDHRLLSYYRAWPKSCPAIDTMLKFFKECFMISRLAYDDATDDDSHSSLVTARLYDSKASGRQEAVRDKAADIEGTSQFFAVYVVPLDHIGIIARMQATVEALRPENIHLDVAFGVQHICIQQTSWRRLELLSV